MKNIGNVKYHASPMIWLFAVSISSVWCATLVNLDYKSQEFAQGWNQSLVQICASNVATCSSLEFSEQGTWFDIEHHILVRAPAHQGEPAKELILQSLTDRQRRYASVDVKEATQVPLPHLNKQSSNLVNRK